MMIDVEGSDGPDSQDGFNGHIYLISRDDRDGHREGGREAWQSGKCLELIVDPEGGDVEPDAVKDVTATLKHKIEGNELDKPVDGDARRRQDGRARRRKAAGARDGHLHGRAEGRRRRATIAFKSVSNRGIVEKT